MSKRGPKPVTRLVLAALSFHMNSDGGSCFPSTQTITRETGLSERSVCTHLEIAVKEGWIKKMIHGFPGQGWKRHEYKPGIPENVLKEIQRLSGEGTEGGSARLEKGTEPHDKKALKEVQSSTSYNSSNNSVPEKKLEKPKSIKSGKSSLKQKSKAKPDRSAAATEIYNTYIKEIAPIHKNTDAGIHNISTHLKEHNRDDLITAITNYKPEGLGYEPKYRKAPSNFFGIKRGNKFFIDYLPGNFVSHNNSKKFPDWH